MQVDTFILLLFCFLFWCLRYDIDLHGHCEVNCMYLCNLCQNLYHQSDHDIPNFCITCVLMQFGKDYTHMVSSAWSDSNECLPF